MEKKKGAAISAGLYKKQEAAARRAVGEQEVVIVAVHMIPQQPIPEPHKS